MDKKSIIWFIYILLVGGYSFSHGFYTLSSILLLLLGFVSFTYSLFSQSPIKIKILGNTTTFVLFISYLFSFLLYGGIYQENDNLKILSIFISQIVLGLIILYINSGDLRKRNLFIIIFGVSILLRILMIISSPDPYIDVYDFLKYGALGLASGQNPYSILYHHFYNGVTPDYYFYLPGAIVLTLPFVLFLGDPRYSIVFFEILAAFILYKLFGGKKGQVAALLLLGNPMSLYILEQSYIEPIILGLLCILAYFWSKRKYVWVGAMLGIIIAVKQYLFILPLLLLKIKLDNRSKSYLLASLILAFIIIIGPFLLWNPKDFIHDVVGLQLDGPPRYEGLTVFSFLRDQFNIAYSKIVSSIIIGGVGLLIMFRKIRSIDSTYLYFSYFLLVFFLFNKWAFVNYYYLISQIFILSLVIDNMRGEKQ